MTNRERPQEYQAWIDAYKARMTAQGQSVDRRCAEATQEMAAAFPELKRVRGFVTCLKWGRSAHWWLTTPSGSIVDPTAEQFLLFPDSYEPWDESQPEPTGKCPNCGEYVYDGAYVHKECEAEFLAHCSRPLTYYDDYDESPAYAWDDAQEDQ